MTDQPKTPLPFSGDDALGWQRTPGVPVYGSGDQCPPPDLDAPLNPPRVTWQPLPAPLPTAPQQQVQQPPYASQQPAASPIPAPAPPAAAMQQPTYQQQAPAAPQQMQQQQQPQAAPPPAYDFPWPSPIGPAQTPGERAKVLGLDWPDDSSSKPEPPSR